MMEKPTLVWRHRNGSHGEIIEELTPESEKLWSDYLTAINLARMDLYENNDIRED